MLADDAGRHEHRRQEEETEAVDGPRLVVLGAKMEISARPGQR